MGKRIAGSRGKRRGLADVKADILARVDVQAEYTRAGVKFTGRVTPGGWHECHAVDRPDDHPSAAVKVEPGDTAHGFYRDQGADVGLSFFKFLAAGAGQGDDIEWIYAWAERLNIPLYPGGRRGAARGDLAGEPSDIALAPSAPPDEELPIRKGRPAPARSANGAATVHYPYDRADGSVSYEVSKTLTGEVDKDGKPAKTFSQRAWVGGRWVYSMRGVERLPYRLPELLAAKPGSWVYVTEGEQCADDVRALGFVATTAQGGVGMGAKTWPGLAHYLAPYRVAVLPDHDDKGYKHANMVCKTLAGVAKEVRLCPLPARRVKDDVSDWISQGGTADGLQAIVAAAPPWTGPTPYPGDPDAVAGLPGALPGVRANGATLARVPIDDEEITQTAKFPPPADIGDVERVCGDLDWLWDGWLARAGIAGVVAAEGAGKTRLVADLLRRVWHGLPWPDGQAATLPAKTPALWICADGQQQEIAKLAREYDLPNEALYLNTGKDDPCGGTTIDQPIDVERLEHYIGVVRPGFVVVDTLTNATSVDMGDASDMALLMAPLSEIAKRTGVTIIVILHLSIAGEALGRRVKGWTRTLLQIECPDPDNFARLRFWVHKSFDVKPAPLGVTMTTAGNEYDDNAPDRQGTPSGPRGGRPPVAREKAKAFIRDRLAAGNSYVAVDLRDELAAENESAGRAFWSAVDEMVAARELFKSDGGPNRGKQVTIRLIGGPALRGDGGAF